MRLTFCPSNKQTRTYLDLTVIAEIKIQTLTIFVCVNSAVEQI